MNQQRKVIAGLRPKSTNSDNRTIWHPKYMPEILCSNQIQNKKTAPFFFDHSGWDPKTQTREHAAREIRKDFEKDLNSYLNLIGQLHGINRKSKQDYSNSLEDHIKWLILYQCSPYFSDREIIDKCAKDQETQQKASNRKEKNVENYNVQAISSGIRNVARLLQMKVREKPKK